MRGGDRETPNYPMSALPFRLRNGRKMMSAYGSPSYEYLLVLDDYGEKYDPRKEYGDIDPGPVNSRMPYSR